MIESSWLGTAMMDGTSKMMLIVIHRDICLAGVSTKHEKKKRKTSDSGALFSGDGTGKSGSSSSTEKPAAAGGSSGGDKSAKAKGSLSRTELNRVKRGGKGKAAFKSKKKFKRRR